MILGITYRRQQWGLVVVPYYDQNYFGHGCGFHLFYHITILPNIDFFQSQYSGIGMLQLN